MSQRSEELMTSRRRFLKYLAASPLLAYWGFNSGRASLAQTPDQGPLDQEIMDAFAQDINVIPSPEKALNVFDFEPAARGVLPPAHYGYLITGVDNDATMRANREDFRKYQLRARRLVDVREIDTSTDLLGEKWNTPIVIAPIASQQAFHYDGEIAVANAARSREQLQILSTLSTESVEDVSRARGRPVWYQLYPTDTWNVTEALVKRAEAAGCPVVVLTVDLLAGSNRESLERFKLMDDRICSDCHDPDIPEWTTRPMFKGMDMSEVRFSGAGLTWEFVDRLKELTTMKVVIKGIVTHEDARLCLAHGVDGIVVSSHGGRAVASSRSTIACLPEVVEAVGGRIPVLIDSGFRRGTDIFKALALGADAICIGRPYLWGLAAFGQPGVEKVLDILRAELRLVMRQMGTTSIAKISRNSIKQEG
ncbi:MAG: alpha-hydroxy-acid oxidizing protein [Candidatus Latescibacteria bacterium]|nr:alpha-hydroxy-acid oxidizing protein [Candidatus Latescibacterota bacterium]